MPRKTGMEGASFSVTPFDKGPSLIDAEGDSMTVDALDALRVNSVTVEGITATDIKAALDDQLYELKRIRRANELQLGESVEAD